MELLIYNTVRTLFLEFDKKLIFFLIKISTNIIPLPIFVQSAMLINNDSFTLKSDH